MEHWQVLGYDKVPHPKRSSSFPVTRFPTFAHPHFTAATIKIFEFSKNKKFQIFNVLVNITRVVNVAFGGSKKRIIPFLKSFGHSEYLLMIMTTRQLVSQSLGRGFISSMFSLKRYFQIFMFIHEHTQFKIFRSKRGRGQSYLQ